LETSNKKQLAIFKFIQGKILQTTSIQAKTRPSSFGLMEKSKPKPKTARWQVRQLELSVD